MGHAAFERAQEDKDAHREWLKEEEELWAAMASPVEINFKLTDWKGKPPSRRRGSRALGTNPRAIRINKSHSQMSI